MSDIISKIPAILREFLKNQYGSEAERIEAGYLEKRPVTFRANALKTTGERIAEALKGRGVSFSRADWYPDAFILRGTDEREIERTEEYLRGEIYLQSLSSMLPPLLLAPKAGESVLDMTAAPGGKTTELAALSGGRALITACEKDKIRFDRLKFNLARQGAAKVTAMNTDAARLDEFFRFDKILLDAPCSGSGTISADAPVAFHEKLLSGCMRSQAALLKKGMKLLKSGGVLLYSTCSVLKQENEEQLKAALPGSGCEIVPLDAPFLKELPLLPSMEGTATVAPDGLFEGFFLASVRKK